MAGEVVGSVSERDLLDALFAGTASLADAVTGHMAQPFELVGSGENLAAARVALQDRDAIMVVDDGKPAGVLTRADLLGFLAG
jgi:cystathionine beta-synthase